MKTLFEYSAETILDNQKIITHFRLIVHFVLKQNEPKIQGCEKIVGGH